MGLGSTTVSETGVSRPLQDYHVLILTSISSIESPDVPLRELVGFPLAPVDPVGLTPTIWVQGVEGWEPAG